MKGVKKKIAIIGILCVFLAGCATLDIVINDKLKMLHAAQLEFKDVLQRYIDIYNRSDADTQVKLQTEVMPKILVANNALAMWENIVMYDMDDGGEQEAWLEAKNTLLMALKPFLVEE